METQSTGFNEPETRFLKETGFLKYRDDQRIAIGI